MRKDCDVRHRNSALQSRLKWYVHVCPPLLVSLHLRKWVVKIRQGNLKTGPWGGLGRSLSTLGTRDTGNAIRISGAFGDILRRMDWSRPRVCKNLVQCCARTLAEESRNVFCGRAVQLCLDVHSQSIVPFSNFDAAPRPARAVIC